MPIIASAQFTLSGSVRDAVDEHALSGASVSLSQDRIAIADEQGRFQFAELAGGTYTLTVSFVGYHRITQTLVLNGNLDLDLQMQPLAILGEEVVVSATRASDNTPTTHSTVTKDEIQSQNFGQDLPFLLNWTPSVVTTSDAGTGIGYTGIRIRGSDATRINVTINGIPYNDSESQGTFWVDIPDIASSSQSIQIQRGVGTSTNGAGAFGASINLQTNTRINDPYAEVVTSLGSFNTRRHTLNFGSGLLRDHWTLDGRLSRIMSDGFIDRAESDLRSYYFSAGFYSDNTILKAIMFGGKERTYQSWYGVPESRLNGDVDAMMVTAANEGWNELQTNNLLASNSRTFNPYLYENQVDDYRQDHFQLHFSRKFSDALTWNTALHYTPGGGFYEEYRYDASFEDYGISPPAVGDSVVESTDLIRRRWLDNDFYGFTWSANFDSQKWNVIAGGSGNRYVGNHYGEIIWAEISPVPNGYRYYLNDADKRDVTTFVKANFDAGSRVNIFADLQYRAISYRIKGIENKLNPVDVEAHYQFFNPKAGVTWTISDSRQIYGSYSIGNREPVRDDFTDNMGSTPQHETLRNLEIGYRQTRPNHVLSLNYYLMDYKNQLVLTGELNDVGATVRTNVDKSYRMGLEAQATVRIPDTWEWTGNVTVSRNKIRDFREVLYDYENNVVVPVVHHNTDISFSPAVVAGSSLAYHPFANAAITWLAKYVGRQYLDNTSNINRSIDSYFVNDIRLAYIWDPGFVDRVTFTLLVNNVFGEQYESNGYTWGYLLGATEYRENYYFPQAGRNYMGMISIRF